MRAGALTIADGYAGAPAPAPIRVALRPPRPTSRPRRGAARVLLLAAGVLLAAAPLPRILVGPVPLYLGDLVLGLLALTFLRPHRLGVRERAMLAWGAAFVASTLPSVVVALVVHNEPLFTLYYFGRRVLSLTTFGTFLVVFTSERDLGPVALHALLVGLLLTSLWCIAQVLTRSTGPVGALDRFYYDVLVQATRETAVARWAAAWKTPRAVAGWWNPNVTGAALSLLFCLLPTQRRGRLLLLTTVAAVAALVTTASRQSVIGAALFLGVVACSSRRTRPSAATAGRGGLLLAVVLACVVAVAFAGGQLARVGGDVEGGIGEGFAARWNNYPEFWTALVESSPISLFFGRGAECWAVVSRTGASVDPGAFVSNTLLLTLAENGLVSLGFFLAFLAVVFRHARTSWQRGIVAVVFWLLNCDNHLYLFPCLAAVMGICLALAAAPRRLVPHGAAA